MIAFTAFDRWANRLRAGGLRRHGTEGTTGMRCSLIEGGRQTCGICHRQPVVAVDADCISQGHPAWYCSTVKEPISECPLPGFVRDLNRRSATKYIGAWAALLATLIVLWRLT